MTTEERTLGNLADGCPKLGRSPEAIEMPSKSKKGAVRCCSHKGQTCVTPKPCLETTFAKAQARCSAIGRHICTAEDLARNKCCRSGCGFDNKLIWHTGSKSNEIKVFELNVCRRFALKFH